MISRFEIHLVRLDPTEGREIRKTRPAVVVSPDDLNRHLGTVIVAPLTTVLRSYPSRVPLRFAGRNGQVALDQLRAVDRSRLIRRLGQVDSMAAHRILAILTEIFSP